MIARTLWFTSLIALALVTIGVQMDRQSRKNPWLAPVVPEIFRSSAQLPVAAYAIDSGDAMLGLAEAEKLVRRRPMPAEHLRLLAQAQYAASDLEASSLTIQYAAQRGWRDPLIQESMLQLALAAGDPAEAARRYAALFVSRDTEDLLLEQLGSRVFEEPTGEAQRVFAEIVAGGARWQNQFLQRGARVLPADAFAKTVMDASKKGADFECRLVGQAVKTIERRDVAVAADLFDSMNARCRNLSSQNGR